MMALLTAILGVVGLGAVYVLLPVARDASRVFRGPRLLACPQTQGPVVVELNANRAARTALFGPPKLAVRNCARWPEPLKPTCAQECLKGVDACAVQRHALAAPLAQGEGAARHS